MSLYEKVKNYNLLKLREFDMATVYPDVSNRGFWDGIPTDEKNRIVKVAENNIDFKYNILRASLAIEFVQNGNRRNYENIYFENRYMLNTFVLAECIENKGRFLSQIIDGLWLMCEETTWALPAHYFLSNDTNILSDKFGKPILDLFALESAHMLAVVVCLLSSVLVKVTPLITERIKREVDERIIKPYLEYDDVFWMGFTDQNAVNNWNPWCSGNVVATALLLCEDANVVARVVDKALRSVDVFYNGYGDDGGCEEGAGYWDRAGASLFEFLELLTKASGGKLYFGDDERFANMGRYIQNVSISDAHFINFADARPNTRVRGDIIYRFGQYIGDYDLASFGANHERNEIYTTDSKIAMSIGREVLRLGLLNEIRAYDREPHPHAKVYMKDIGVVIARSEERYNAGLVLAAKFGHNGECHNHNDVGSFVLYKNGTPIIIDVGVGVYTAETFSDKRYDIWYMNSLNHNTPIINGIGQKDGRESAANDYSYTDDDGICFGANIQNAYPEGVVNYWHRSFRMRDNKVELCDEFDAVDKIELVFMTKVEPQKLSNGIKIDSALLISQTAYEELIIEKIDITDPLLESCWGTNVYRTRFVFDSCKKRQKTAFVIS